MPRIVRSTRQDLLWSASLSTHHAWFWYYEEGDQYAENSFCQSDHADMTEIDGRRIKIAPMIKWNTDEAIEEFSDLLRQYKEEGISENIVCRLSRFRVSRPD